MRWLWGAWLPVLLATGCLGPQGAGDAGAGTGEEPAAQAREETAPALDLPELQPQSREEPPAPSEQPQANGAHDEQPPDDPEPAVAPDGYRIVEADRYAFAVPDGWQVEEKALHDEFFFLVDGETIGETGILGWFDAESWPDFKPNHSEQIGFEERNDLASGRNGNIRVYRIGLVHTKPAAALDPEWRYEEIRWYVANRDDGLAYGFCFDSQAVDEAVMETIVSSFRLRKAGDGK